MRIAILDDYQRVAREFGDWSQLPEGTEVASFSDHAGPPEQVIARLRPFEVVVAMRERTSFPREVLRELPQLRLLVTTGYRNAAIDIDAAHELGIVVSGTGGHLSGTPELTWGLILAVLRHLTEEHASIRAGGWQHTLGGDLAGSTLGVIGLGNMGSYVARIGKAFDMRVVAWSENLTAERCTEQGVELVSKWELLRDSDVVTVHLQLSPRTRGLIGAPELALMKREAILINTSRGPIIDEAALVAGLAAGEIAGAGIDVYDVEPLAQHHALRHAPHVVTTPHIGYVTRNCYRTFMEEAVEDIASFLKGQPLRVIDPI